MTGDDMAWQEFYILNADNTFVKSRTRDGQTKEEGGTYSFTTYGDEEYIELLYKMDNDLIGSCTAEPKELLIIKSTSEVYSTWNACDGPGLTYRRVDCSS